MGYGNNKNLHDREEETKKKRSRFEARNKQKNIN